MFKKTTFIILITVLMVTMTFAQGRGRNRANRMHTFDVTAPVNITGKIVKVTTLNTGNGWYGTGIRLTIVENGKQFPVILGPTAYVNSNKWVFKEGETLTVNAFKGTGNDNGTWFAAGITRGGNQLTLRDAKGFPMWRRGMKGRRGGGRGAGRGAGRRFNR